VIRGKVTAMMTSHPSRAKHDVAIRVNSCLFVVTIS
jgi:hypothetical protein